MRRCNWVRPGKMLDLRIADATPNGAASGLGLFCFAKPFQGGLHQIQGGFDQIQCGLDQIKAGSTKSKLDPDNSGQPCVDNKHHRQVLITFWGW